MVIEPGPASALNAMKRGLRNVVHATVEAVGFRPNTLAAVGLFDGFEDIESNLAFIAYVQSLMKADGRIYLTVPAFRAL